jgi:hypothetical protein
MKSYRVLTIRQPWAHLIIEGIKPVENRSWSTSYRGLILIHAAQARDAELISQFDLDPDALAYGAVIGCADLVDIVDDHPSPFFNGPCGWVLRKPQRIEPIPLQGKLSLWEATLKLPPLRRRR